MTDEARRLECWSRFTAAVRAYRSGNTAHVQFYLRGVEVASNRAIAEQQRTELVRYAKSDKSA